MTEKKVVILVDNEAAIAAKIIFLETEQEKLNKINAIFASNPTVMLTDDVNVVEGSVWNGEFWTHPVE